ncbi:chemotaxis protein CheC [Trinickia caryophylli]|uniref:Chemotaxis protein CheC n=1 Tax=Trinickia caryophylli TaxID=28094 RepID=A0A1X7EUW8_TRICW|nr:chemotaxis protein CheC [Trinickia caryophylli]PMS12187.1 chemotaxis protein [Trinickia caryophylli]TRX18505.1 chemotaxis protein [Trinickia caryophylli]WQE10706.1 chemotaxis protein CheC [Trinickia caryophylli]SMF40636.1 chemotaxis protein CheC [Trinickia caryophylli]GLU33078.1 chemotaxis protein [Trinickia caryophylli]
MNNALTLNEDRRDALQEIANIGMGQAGARLATLLGRFIHLSVPRIRMVDTESLPSAVRDMLDFTEPVTALRQSFRCDVAGEAISLFDSRSAAHMKFVFRAGECEAPSAQEDDADDVEALSDVSNLIAGACLTGLFEQIGQVPTFTPPRVMGLHLDLGDILHPSKLPWDRALLLEVTLQTEDGVFGSHLLTLMTAKAVEALVSALDGFLANL